MVNAAHFVFVGTLPCVHVPGTKQPSKCCGFKVLSIFKALTIRFGDSRSVRNPAASVDSGSGLLLQFSKSVMCCLRSEALAQAQECLQELINNFMCLLSMCLPMYCIVWSPWGLTVSVC